jgi:hypothetical protein
LIDTGEITLNHATKFNQLDPSDQYNSVGLAKLLERWYVAFGWLNP